MVRNGHLSLAKFVLLVLSHEPSPQRGAENAPVGSVASAQVMSELSVNCDVQWVSRGGNQATFRIITV